MVYGCRLETGQQVYVENQGAQTVITVIGSGPGQQQSQRTGISTGEWTAPPSMFRTSQGLVLRVETSQGHAFFQIQASQISTMRVAPALRHAEVLPMQQVAASDAPAASMQPMEPMQPMQPMQPMEPMQMRMGNMQMQMGDTQHSGQSHASSSAASHTEHHSATAPTPGGSFTREQIMQAIDSLDMRVSMGEISEETYNRLLKKWQDKLHELER